MKLPRFKIILFAIDLLFLSTSFCLAFYLSKTTQNKSYPLFDNIKNIDYLLFFLLSIFGVAIIFQNYHLYKINIVLTRSRQFVQLTISFFYAMISLTVISFFLQHQISLNLRLFVISYAFIGMNLLTIFRIAIFRPLYIYLNKQQVIKKNILIVGTTIQAKNLIIQCVLDNIYGLNIVGFVNDLSTSNEEVFENVKKLGTIKEISSIVKKYKVDEILITLTDIPHRRLLNIIDICKLSHARVQVSSPILEIIHNKIFSDRYFNVPLARFSNNGQSRSKNFIKRIFDIAGSAIGLIILLLPFAIISTLIKLTSKGPVLFHQIRIGKDGKPFVFYKFRSMYLGSENDNERKIKMKSFISEKGNLIVKKNYSKVVNERKITPIGRFLRKTSIDELPQFINVLKGDMSLVGPRPCLPYEYEYYDEWHKRRLSITPGCTGLWQVEARSNSSFEEMVLLDLYYIENLSFWFDLQLILKTIPVMLFQKGGK